MLYFQDFRFLKALVESRKEVYIIDVFKKKSKIDPYLWLIGVHFLANSSGLMVRRERLDWKERRSCSWLVESAQDSQGAWPLAHPVFVLQSQGRHTSWVGMFSVEWLFL